MSRRRRGTNLDDDSSLVESERNVVPLPGVRDTPCTLEAIVERVLESVGARMPDLDRAVLRAGDEDGQGGVEDGKGHIRGVALERLDTRLGEVVPDFDEAVVARGDEVGLVSAVVVLDVVDPLVVRVEREVGGRGTEGPNLDGAVETGRGERVGVLRVERDVHDVVRVSLEDLAA